MVSHTCSQLASMHNQAIKYARSSCRLWRALDFKRPAMTIEEAAKFVAVWASEKPQISKVHFYGSRVKKTHREDSDLDIAVALIANLDESGGLATWMHYSDQWSQELNKAIPYEVQLEWDAGNKTPIIKKGLAEGSQLVYEKEV